MATTTMTVSTLGINSVDVKVKGTDGVYMVTADVMVHGETVGNMENGCVKKADGSDVANWSKYGNMNINFLGGMTAEEQVSVLEAVNSFVAGVLAESVSQLVTVSAS